MTTAEYIEYHPDGKRFVLPAEHAAVLADEAVQLKTLAGPAQPAAPQS